MWLYKLVLWYTMVVILLPLLPRLKSKRIPLFIIVSSSFFSGVPQKILEASEIYDSAVGGNAMFFGFPLSPLASYIPLINGLYTTVISAK